MAATMAPVQKRRATRKRKDGEVVDAARKQGEHQQEDECPSRRERPPPLGPDEIDDEVERHPGDDHPGQPVGQPKGVHARH